MALIGQTIRQAITKKATSVPPNRSCLGSTRQSTAKHQPCGHVTSQRGRAVAFTYGDGLFHLGGGNDFQLRKDGEFASCGRYYLNDRVRGGEMTGLVSSMAGADGGGGEMGVFTIEPKE